jgi:hypothetical protein
VESLPDVAGTAVAEGRLKIPGAHAFAYMTSAGQHLGERVGRWHPHVMLYSPYSTDALWGAKGLDPDFPFVTEDGTALVGGDHSARPVLERLGGPVNYDAARRTSAAGDAWASTMKRGSPGPPAPMSFS